MSGEEYIKNEYTYICGNITDDYLESLIKNSLETVVNNWSLCNVKTILSNYDDYTVLKWDDILDKYCAFCKIKDINTLTYEDIDATIYDFIQQEYNMPILISNKVVGEYIKRYS